MTRDVVGSVAVITLAGDLDAGAAALMTDDLLPIMPEHADMLIDLGRVAHLTSAGLRILLRLYRQGQCLDSTVALVGLSAELRNVVDAAGFLGYFAVADSVADGVELLSRSTDRRESVDA